MTPVLRPALSQPMTALRRYGGTVAERPRRDHPVALVRNLLGDALRRARQQQQRTLREVSATARVSLGYLSEVERGQKEASSELLGAIAAALGVPLSEVLREVSDELALAEARRATLVELPAGDPPVAAAA